MTLTVALPGTACVPGKKVYVLRAGAACGRASRRRVAPRESTGSTWYLPASTYHSGDHLDQLVAMLVGHVVILGYVLIHVVQLPAARHPVLVSSSAVIGAPKNFPASAKEGPGHGQTARQPSW